MRNIITVSDEQWQTFIYWLSPITSATVAGFAFTSIGNTPIIRAVALAGTILVMALALRRFGGLVAFAGGLALAFSPAFWSQTGGGQPLMVTLIVALIVIAGIATFSFIWFAKRPGLGLAAGLVIFTVLFWELVGISRSLRLTTFLNVSLIYLMIDGLLTANPRPDESEPAPLKAYHTWGLLLILALGVMNDSLLILNAPAVILGLILSRTRLPRWYWIFMGIVVVIGLRGVAMQYLNSTWWTYPAAQAEALNIRVPFMMADGWREASRWVELLNLITRQFSVIGLFLCVLGLSRLSRWYPPLGVVTMIAYTSYAVFGLVYFGGDSPVILLPLLMIQVLWMSYAVYAFGQWLQKVTQTSGAFAEWIAPATFILLPIAMLLRIAGVL